MFIENGERNCSDYAGDKKKGKLRCPVVCHENENGGKIFMFGCMGPESSICAAYKFICSPQVELYNNNFKSIHERYDALIKNGTSHVEAVGGTEKNAASSSSASAGGANDGAQGKGKAGGKGKG